MLLGVIATSTFDPVYGPLAIIAAATMLAATLARSVASSHQSADPLSGLFEANVLENEIEAAERRKAQRAPRPAILSGKIDSIGQVGNLWGPETRAEAIDQVARVMRASVRDGDRIEASHGPDGNGSFVVIAAGATEAEASGIAQRLLSEIEETQIAGMAKHMRLTASIGVASQKRCENEAQWHARARAALDTAINSAEDRIVTASDWEEIRLLPAPAPSNQAA